MKHKAVEKHSRAGDALESVLPEEPADDAAGHLAKPPDGGWGWVIVLASFMNQFILDGIAYAFGVFMSDYMDYFGSSKAQTGALMSTLLGFYMLTAPVASGLINQFGLRAVGIAGSLLAGVAFALCTLSPNIEYMILLFGVMGGFGFGLMFMPAVISVGYYFDKKRAIATGIAMCGTGVGTFTFGPFGSYLLEVFDWKNAHYILAGIIFNGIIFSSLIRPLSTHVNSNKSKAKARVTTSEASTKTDRPMVPLLTVTNEHGDSVPSSFDKRDHSYTRSTPQLAPPGGLVSNGDGKMAVARSTTALSINTGSGEHATAAQLSISHINKPMYRKDIFYSGSIHQLPGSSTLQPNVALYATSSKSIHSVHLNEPNVETSACCSCLPRNIGTVIGNMLDVKLFKDANFLVISVASLFSMAAYLTPFAFTNVRAMSLGVNREQASLLISLLGITNMVGRLSASAVAQIPRLRALLVHNISLGISSACVMMMPFCTSYATIAVCASGYGFFIGGHASLCPIILCDLLGLERLTSAYGLLTLVRGIAVLIGPTLAGAISDVTGSFDMAFYVGGTMMAISTLLFFLLHLPYFTSKSKASIAKAEK